jgi:hypothetical protein
MWPEVRYGTFLRHGAMSDLGPFMRTKADMEADQDRSSPQVPMRGAGGIPLCTGLASRA